MDFRGFFLLMETIIEIRRTPGLGKLIRAKENWFSGLCKPLIFHFLKTPVSDGVFPSSRKVVFNEILHFG